MNRQQIERAVAYGFVDSHLPHSSRFAPLLIDNQRSFTMSRAIRAELRHADSFVFSVAFVTPGALNVLKQDLLDFKGSGRIITSNYLGFNSPETDCAPYPLEILFFPAPELLVAKEPSLLQDGKR